MLRFYVLLGTLCILSGCATTSSLDRQARLDNPNKNAIIVLGIEPELFNINIMKGKLENSKFAFSNVTAPTAWAPPENGYLVLKVPVLKPNEIYAVVRVGQKLSYTSQCDWPALTFKPVAGKLNYISHIKYSWLSESSIFEGLLSSKANEAEQYLKSNFPNLEAEFIEKGYTFTTISGFDCKKEYKRVNPIQYTK